MPAQNDYAILMDFLLDSLFLFKKDERIFSFISTISSRPSQVKKTKDLLNGPHRFNGHLYHSRGVTQLNHIIPQSFLKPLVLQKLVWSPTNLVAVRRGLKQVVDADHNIDIPSLIGACSSYATYALSKPQPSFFKNLSPPCGLPFEAGEDRQYYIKRVLGYACKNWGIVQAALVMAYSPHLNHWIDKDKIKLGPISRQEDIWWFKDHNEIPLNNLTVMAFNDSFYRSTSEVLKKVTEILTPLNKDSKPYEGSVLSANEVEDMHMPRHFRDF